MKLTKCLVLAAGLTFAYSMAWAHDSSDYSEVRILGDTNGNHELSCTVVRPWGLDDAPDPDLVPYPVLGWLNGWDQGNVVGQLTLRGYLPGLIQLAVDQRMIVIAANQWSARNVDMVRCLDWLAEQNETAGSDYEGLVDTDHVGIIGHSQGGGGVLKVGADSSPNYSVAGVVAIHPYGPKWTSLGPQEAPVFFLAGGLDTTTPTSSIQPAWDQVAVNGIGGLFAEKPTGTHNGDAWAPADDFDNPQNYDFGDYQEAIRLWLSIFLEGEDKGAALLTELSNRGIDLLGCSELTFCP